jgi:ABC-type nickel/cobalt efflux system permease component RcnA
MRSRRLILGILTISLIAAGNAVAHPLGNFSINQYSAIRIGKTEIELRYIVDTAEIPTFQEIQQTGLVPQAGDASATSYLLHKVETLRDGLLLEVNGRRIALRTVSREILFPEGAGGLPTMKIGAVYKGKLDDPAGEPHQLFYRDENFPGRAGWKEIIAIAASGSRLIDSSVPTQDRSAQLSDYPTDLLNSPPQAREARLTFASGGIGSAYVTSARSPLPIRQSIADNGHLNIANPRDTSVAGTVTKPTEISSSADGPIPGSQSLDIGRATSSDSLQPNKRAMSRNSFMELIAAKRLDWPMIWLAFLVAAVLGAFHALEPGHGKTLVAAYLVGSRGTMKHALILGLIVTAAHTGAVYLLGGVTLYASRYIVPERLYPWLTLVSGLMITSLGAALFLQRYSGGAGQAAHHHHGDVHDHHHHDHSHHHHGHGGHPHDHHELTQKVSGRQLLALGISGGIVPCPAALVVLLSALSMQRVGFGLLLIVAFSLGLAAVLISIGLLMVYARQFMVRFQGNGQLATHWLPLTSSAFIVLFGVGLTGQALMNAGFLRL